MLYCSTQNALTAMDIFTRDFQRIYLRAKLKTKRKDIQKGAYISICYFLDETKIYPLSFILRGTCL